MKISRLFIFPVFLLLVISISRVDYAQSQLQDSTSSQPKWVSSGAGSIRIDPPATRVAIGTRRAPLGVLHINGEFDASLQRGPSGTIHLSHGVHSLLLDSNEILARKLLSGTTELPKKFVGSTLNLNAEGGGVLVNGRLTRNQHIQLFEDGSMFVGKSMRIGAKNSAHSDKELIVGGTVVAKEIIVTPDNWADDVFKDGYQFKSNDELATYIFKYKHLPGIASEEEIIENGLILGEFNVGLLRNVEELTVRLLQQHKKHTSEKQILEARISALEKLVAYLIENQS